MHDAALMILNPPVKRYTRRQGSQGTPPQEDTMAGMRDYTDEDLARLL